MKAIKKINKYYSVKSLLNKIYRPSHSANIQISNTINLSDYKSIKFLMKIKTDNNSMSDGDGRLFTLQNNTYSTLAIPSNDFAWLPGALWFDTNMEANINYWIEFNIDIINSSLVLRISQNKINWTEYTNLFSDSLGSGTTTIYLGGFYNTTSDVGFKGLIYLDDCIITGINTNDDEVTIFDGNYAIEGTDFINNNCTLMPSAYEYRLVDFDKLKVRNYSLGWNLNNRSEMISFGDIYIQSGQEASSNYNGRISISYDKGNTWTLYSSSLPNGTTLSGNPVAAICIKDNNGNDRIAVSTDDYDTYVFDKNFTTLVGTIADGTWTHSLGWTWNPNLSSKGDCWIKGTSVNPSHVNLSTYEKTSIYSPTGISSSFPSCRYYGIPSPKYYYINDSILYESSSAEGPYTQSQISLPTITNFKALIGFKGKLLCICLNKIYYLDINNNWIECDIDGINMSTVTKMNLNVNHNNDIYAVSVITGSLSCKIIYTLDGECWYYKDFIDTPIIRSDNYSINCGKIYNNMVDFCITNSIGSNTTYYNFILHCSIDI